MVDPVLGWMFAHPTQWSLQHFAGHCRVEAAGSVPRPSPPERRSRRLHPVVGPERGPRRLRRRADQAPRRPALHDTGPRHLVPLSLTQQDLRALARPPDAPRHPAHEAHPRLAGRRQRLRGLGLGRRRRLHEDRRRIERMSPPSARRRGDGRRCSVPRWRWATCRSGSGSRGTGSSSAPISANASPSSGGRGTTSAGRRPSRCSAAWARPRRRRRAALPARLRAAGRQGTARGARAPGTDALDLLGHRRAGHALPVLRRPRRGRAAENRRRARLPARSRRPVCAAALPPGRARVTATHGAGRGPGWPEQKIRSE